MEFYGLEWQVGESVANDAFSDSNQVMSRIWPSEELSENPIEERIGCGIVTQLKAGETSQD